MIKLHTIKEVFYTPSKTSVRIKLILNDESSVNLELSMSDAKDFADGILKATQFAELPENKE